MSFTPVPGAVVHVAFGPDRDAVFEQATSHFDDETIPWRRRLDVTDLEDGDEVFFRILNFVRTGLDEIAVKNPGPHALNQLVGMADTRKLVVVSMDVASLDEARAQMADAANRPWGIHQVADLKETIELATESRSRKP